MRTPEPPRPAASIELLLDTAAEDAIRAEWDALAACGMSSLAAHTSASNRPHVTLLARASLPRLDAGVFAEVGAVPLVLGEPVLFGTGERRVLARRVAPTPALLGIRETVLAAAGPGVDAPHTEPGTWIPHVTLARRLRVADIDAALDLLGDDIHGHARSVRHWDPELAVTTTLADLNRP